MVISSRRIERFANILFVTDLKPRNNAAFRKALELAAHNDAILSVATVIEEPPYEKIAKVADVPEKVARRSFKLACEEMLDEFVEQAEKKSIRINLNVLEGVPHVEIIRDAVKFDRDLVILSTREKTGIKKMFYGSLAMKLIRLCPCPVWVARPDQENGLKRIMAAVNLDLFDRRIRPLVVKIMDIAASLAVTEDCELHVLHAWSFIGESVLRTPAALAQPGEIDRLMKTTESFHAKKLDRVIENYTTENRKIIRHLVSGSAGYVIPKTVRGENIDLLVMGSVGRTGLEGFFIGNTAEKVLQEVECSVLTVKPDGFVTPVK